MRLGMQAAEVAEVWEMRRIWQGGRMRQPRDGEDKGEGGEWRENACGVREAMVSGCVREEFGCSWWDPGE